MSAEPFGAVTKYRLEVPAAKVKGYEFKQSFRVRYSGPVNPDPREVLATRAIELRALRAEMRQQPDMFTPWFRKRAAELGLFESVV